MNIGITTDTYRLRAGSRNTPGLSGPLVSITSSPPATADKASAMNLDLKAALSPCPSRRLMGSEISTSPFSGDLALSLISFPASSGTMSFAAPEFSLAKMCAARVAWIACSRSMTALARQVLGMKLNRSGKLSRFSSVV